MQNSNLFINTERLHVQVTRTTQCLYLAGADLAWSDSVITGVAI